MGAARSPALEPAEGPRAGPHRGVVLVTGATGFTGGHLSARLAREGVPIRALVRDPARAAATHPPGVELAAGDLRDPASLAPAGPGGPPRHPIPPLLPPATHAPG